jgi:hypothetical protein
MPRIVYVSWPPVEISGGIKAAFQHVEFLRAAGIEAAIATERALRPTWFESSAPVITFEDVAPADILVLPENNPAYVQAFAASSRTKVVFCQNPVHLHRGLAGRRSFADWGVSRIMCASHTLLRYCENRFPGMKLAYTPFCIDDAWFAAPPAKSLQVAVIPRKRTLEFPAIVDYACALEPELGEIKWAVIQQATEKQVAETMARSAVFLSLARLEAHSMTQLEAMASGCIVAGFTGVHGGNDSATASNGFWAGEDDIAGCAEQLARAVRLVRAGGDACEAVRASGRRTAEHYRRSAVAPLVVDFWKQVLRESAA